MTDKIVVLCTCSSIEEAEKVARAIVEKRIAACVNILPGIRSIYRWRDAVEDAQETLLIVKSRRALVPVLREEIARLHSYEVPEVIALQIVDGSTEYLEWLDRETRPVPEPPTEPPTD